MNNKSFRKNWNELQGFQNNITMILERLDVTIILESG